MQVILSGICLAAAVCLEPPAAEYAASYGRTEDGASPCASNPKEMRRPAASDDYGLRSRSGRLDDGAKRLLSEWGATPYVRKAGRTDIFVRAQRKYGIKAPHMTTEEFKARLKRLQLENEKLQAEIDRLKGGADEEIDDGFIEALSSTAAEDWSDE